MKPLSRLTEEDWKDLRNRLRFFVFKKYGWLEHKWGLELDVVIQDAIVDTLLGVRRWPPVDEQGQERKVALFIFLCGTIRSKISHILENEKRKVSLDEVIENEQSDTIQLSAGKASTRHVDSIRSKYESDQHAIYHQLCERIRGLVVDDAILARMVDLWFDMPDLKPADIASMLGLRDEEVRKAQKRLDRRLQKFRKEWINV